jgi:hypothetical protein
VFSPGDCLVDFTLCFGRLPDPWWGQWKERGTCFNEDGVLEHEEDFVAEAKVDLETKIRNGCAGMNKEEYAWLRNIM